MTLAINSNLSALKALNSIDQSARATAASAARLSSGSRVELTGDDPSSLVVGRRLSTEVSALGRAGLNINEARSQLQIVDGSLARIADVITRMKVLAVQAGSENLGDYERSLLDLEYQQLIDEINRLSGDSEYNGRHLLNRDLTPGDFSSGLVGGEFFSAEGENGFVNATVRGVDNRTVANGGDGDFRLFIRFFQNNLTMPGTTLLTFNVNLIFNDKGTQNRIFYQIHLNLDDVTSQVITDDGAGNFTLEAPLLINVPFRSYVVGGPLGGGGVEDFDPTGPTTNLEEYTKENAEVLILIDKSFDLNTGTGAPNDFRVSSSFLDNQTDFEANIFTVGSGILPNRDKIDSLLKGATARYLGLASTNIADVNNADAASLALSSALDEVAELRAFYGAKTSSLDSAFRNLTSTIENTEGARSALTDLDVAREISLFTSKQMLLDSGVAVLSQANSMQFNLLDLFV